MEASSRLKNAWRARGLAGLDMEAVRKREERRRSDEPLSARSSPGGSAKSPASPGSPGSGKSIQSASTTPVRATKPAVTTVPSAPPAALPSLPPPAQITQPAVTTQPALLPPPAALTTTTLTTSSTSTTSTSSVPPPRLITTSAPFILPPPTLNAPIESPKSPASPKSTTAFSFFSSTTSISSSSSTIASTTTTLPPPPPPPPPPASTKSSVLTTTSTTSSAPAPAESTTTSSAANPAVTTSSQLPPPPPPPVVSQSLQPVPTLRPSSVPGTTNTPESSKTTLSTQIVPRPSLQPGTTTQLAPLPILSASSSAAVIPNIPAVTGAEPQASQPASVGSPNNGISTNPTGLPSASTGSGNGQNEAGAKVGIAVGTIAGVGMLAAILFFFFKRYKRRQAFLDKPYGDEDSGRPKMSGGGRQPTIFNTIQERFHNFTAPVATRMSYFREKGANGGYARGVGVAGGVAAGGGLAANGDPKTQSQIINDMFQAAYAAENGMGGRNSAYGSEYPIDEKQGGGYYGQQEMPQGTLRDSMSRWLRGSSVNPLQQNPMRESEQSRFTAPSWTRSVRSSTASSMLSEGDGVTSGVNSGLFPPGFRPASPLPPVPPIPASTVQSRWSESTRSPETPLTVSHDSLYSMYKRDTQVSGPTDSVVPGVPEWWRDSEAAVNPAERASSNALGPSAGNVSAGLPTPATPNGGNMLQQPDPVLPRNGQGRM